MEVPIVMGEGRITAKLQRNQGVELVNFYVFSEQKKSSDKRHDQFSLVTMKRLYEALTFPFQILVFPRRTRTLQQFESVAAYYLQHHQKG